MYLFCYQYIILFRMIYWRIHIYFVYVCLLVVHSVYWIARWPMQTKLDDVRTTWKV